MLGSCMLKSCVLASVCWVKCEVCEAVVMGAGSGSVWVEASLDLEVCFGIATTCLMVIGMMRLVAVLGWGVLVVFLVLLCVCVCVCVCVCGMDECE